MTETIELRLTRETDREALQELLQANGIETEPLDDESGLGFRVPYEDGDEERACDELVAQLESLVAGADLPLVPQRGDGYVVLRPAAD